MTVRKKLMQKMCVAGSLLAIAFMTGCQKDDTENNVLLSHIPADTPVIVSIEINDRVLPRTLVDKYDQAFDAAVRFQRERFKLALEPALQQASDPGRTAMAEKAIGFADRWMTAEKLRQMGLDPRDLAVALYAVDLIPVLRAKIASEALGEQFLDELFALFGEAQTVPASYVVEKNKDNGQITYTVRFGDSLVVIQLGAGQAVTAFAPAAVLEKHIETILGVKKPSQPLTQSPRLEAFFSRYGYRPGHLFWIDWKQLAGYFVDPGAHPSDLLDHYGIGKNNLPPLCKEEILELVGAFPRVVGGIREVGDHDLVNQILWEMDAGVAQKLAATSGEIPAFLPQTRLGFGFGFNLPAVEKLATEWALAVQNKPYQCDKLQGLNVLASAVQARDMPPVLPFISNFKGFSFSLEDWQLDLEGVDSDSTKGVSWAGAERLKKAKLAAGITFENPAALVGMIQLASAGLLHLPVKADGKAVDLSQAPGWQALDLPANLEPVWMAMAGDKLMLTVGIKSPFVVENLVTAPGEKKTLKGVIQADYYQTLVDMLQPVLHRQAVGSATGRKNHELALRKGYLEAGLWWKRQVVEVGFGDGGVEINVETVFD